MSKTRSSIIGVRISSDSCYDYELRTGMGFHQNQWCLRDRLRRRINKVISNKTLSFWRITQKFLTINFCHIKFYFGRSHWWKQPLNICVASFTDFLLKKKSKEFSQFPYLKINPISHPYKSLSWIKSNQLAISLSHHEGII